MKPMFSLLALMWICVALSEKPSFAQGSYQERLLEELMLATPGTVIEIPEGVFEFDRQLSLVSDGVTIKGQGMNRSVLSFNHQAQGAEGLLVSGNHIILKDFTIQNTIGDAIKINNSHGLMIEGVQTRWTNGPSMDNGGYGFYPVQSKDIIIQGCVVSGASDAGIYVGQSKNVIVRRNIAQFNVAGIEIENSQDVDVSDNYVSDNTGGILVFDIPGLSIKGDRVRVFSNTVVRNNTINFSHPSNIVADVPSGTGIMVTANKHVEIFNNLVASNDTTNILLVSFAITGRPIADPDYNPFVESIYIHDNSLLKGGKNPQGGKTQQTRHIVSMIKDAIGSPFPHIIYDGSSNSESEGSRLSNNPANICIEDNHQESFVDLDFTHNMRGLSFDIAKHRCSLERLDEVIISF